MVALPPLMLIWAHSICRPSQELFRKSHTRRLPTHVKLSTARRAGGVEGNHLGAQEILAVLETVGDLDGVLPRVLDDFARGPDTVAVAFLLDLEPAVVPLG